MRRPPFAFGLSGAMPRWRGTPLALVRRARPYVHAIPQILAYQVVTKLALLVVLAGLKELASWALASQGRVAVTSGDWRFLFTSWQGWVLVLAGLAVLYAYIAFDLNVKVAYSGHVVRGEQVWFGGPWQKGWRPSASSSARRASWSCSTSPCWRPSWGWDSPSDE